MFPTAVEEHKTVSQKVNKLPDPEQGQNYWVLGQGTEIRTNMESLCKP